MYFFLRQAPNTSFTKITNIKFIISIYLKINTKVLIIKLTKYYYNIVVIKIYKNILKNEKINKYPKISSP